MFFLFEIYLVFVLNSIDCVTLVLVCKRRASLTGENIKRLVIVPDSSKIFMVAISTVVLVAR